VGRPVKIGLNNRVGESPSILVEFGGLGGGARGTSRCSVVSGGGEHGVASRWAEGVGFVWKNKNSRGCRCVGAGRLHRGRMVPFRADSIFLDPMIRAPWANWPAGPTEGPRSGSGIGILHARVERFTVLVGGSHFRMIASARQCSPKNGGRLSTWRSASDVFLFERRRVTASTTTKEKERPRRRAMKRDHRRSCGVLSAEGGRPAVPRRVLGLRADRIPAEEEPNKAAAHDPNPAAARPTRGADARRRWGDGPGTGIPNETSRDFP